MFKFLKVNLKVYFNRIFGFRAVSELRRVKLKTEGVALRVEKNKYEGEKFCELIEFNCICGPMDSPRGWRHIGIVTFIYSKITVL